MSDQQDPESGEPSLACLRLELQAHRAWIGNNELQLEPRGFNLLAALAQCPERVFAKSELFEMVWAGRVVGDAALTQAVAKLRRELADAGGDAAWIRTVHGVGYAFDGPLLPGACEPLEAPEHTAPPSPPSPGPAMRAQPRRQLSLGLISVCVLLLVLISVWMQKPIQQPQRIAIVPFDIDAQAAGLDYGELALPALVGAVLEGRSSVGVVEANRVRRGLENLQHPADAEEAETVRVIRDLFGVDHVLFANLAGADGNLTLDYRLYRSANPVRHGSATSKGLGGLAIATAEHVATDLDVAYAVGIPVRRLVADEFVNEAFARGLQAMLSGELIAAERYFQTALQDANDSGWLHYELGNAQRQQGKYDAAASSYQRARELAQEHADNNLAGVSDSGLGLLDWRAGRMSDAQLRFEQAREHFLVVGNRANLGAAIGNLGILADNRGELDTAQTLYEEALALYRDSGERAGETACYSNLAVIARKRGQLDAAADLQSRALDLQRRYGLGQMTIFSATHLAEIERRRGRWEHATQLLDQASEAAKRAGDTPGSADILSSRAALANDLGQSERSMQLMDQAMAVYSALKLPLGEMRVRLQRAEQQMQVDVAAARTDLDRAREIARSLGDRDTELHVELLRALLERDEAKLYAATAAISAEPGAGSDLLQAEARWQTARHSSSETDYLEALELARSGGDPRLQALIALDLARLRLIQGSSESIESLLGRVEAWRVEHPQTLAIRACQRRLAGRHSEAAVLEQRAASLPGARVSEAWCPAESEID